MFWDITILNIQFVEQSWQLGQGYVQVYVYTSTWMKMLAIKLFLIEFFFISLGQGDRVYAWVVRHVQVYVDLKGSAAMVVNKNYAGVTSEENLRNPLHVGNKVPKQGIHPDFKTGGRCQQRSKTGVSVAPQKMLMSSNLFLKCCVAVSKYVHVSHSRLFWIHLCRVCDVASFCGVHPQFATSRHCCSVAFKFMLIYFETIDFTYTRHLRTSSHALFGPVFVLQINNVMFCTKWERERTLY